MIYRAALLALLLLGYSSISLGQTPAANSLPPSPPAMKKTSVTTVTLGDVEYRDNTDWTIWINGQKVTPTVSMMEIVDIKVEPDVVHLKWFDIGQNYVRDFVIHPHETYDLVTGAITPAPAATAPK